jgi:hypothetical protein
VIVSVYAAGAVPGAFVPGARAAFLTSATMAALAFAAAFVALRPRLRPRRESAAQAELELAA